MAAIKQKSTTIAISKLVIQMMQLKYLILPEGHFDYGKNVAAYYYWVFPNMMFNFYPGDFL